MTSSGPSGHRTKPGAERRTATSVIYLLYRTAYPCGVTVFTIWPDDVEWRRASPKLFWLEFIGHLIGEIIAFAICLTLWLIFDIWWIWLIFGAGLLITLIQLSVLPRSLRSWGYAERVDDLLVRHGLMFSGSPLSPMDGCSSSMSRPARSSGCSVWRRSSCTRPRRRRRRSPRTAAGRGGPAARPPDRAGPGPGGGDMTAPAAGAEPRRRLHPLTPLLRGARLAVLAIVAISWQGYQNLGTQRWLLAIVAVAVLVLLGSAVSYLVTGYHIVGRELRVYEGSLFRRTRTIPVERLQAVELVQPLLARLAAWPSCAWRWSGPARPRLRWRSCASTRPGHCANACSTWPRSGGARSRWPRATAGSLDGSFDGTLDNQGGPAGVATVAALERPVHTVSNRDLVISGVARPRAPSRRPSPPRPSSSRSRAT